MAVPVLHGDCLTVMAGMTEASVDAIVTDPPYGLSFMGKAWDHGVPGSPFWVEALRVAKPGAHLLAFGGTRTFHRLTCAIEDAGWEIRDCVMWVYGSGFPKSLDVSKAIDKAAGETREVVGIKGNKGRVKTDGWGLSEGDGDPITVAATVAAHQWTGWGTALKPAWEPIIVARKPVVGTVAQNVQTFGTGAINVDACRVGTNKNVPASGTSAGSVCYSPRGPRTTEMGGFNPNTGRWPANLIHDGSEEVLALFPETHGAGTFRNGSSKGRLYFPKDDEGPSTQRPALDGGGSAARFFYCAKASRSDRTEKGSVDNKHPTVKPSALMRYLVKLVTPPNGTVLDPFCGSGSTGKAAILEGFKFIGIELDAENVGAATARREAHRTMFDEAS